MGFSHSSTTTLALGLLAAIACLGCNAKRDSSAPASPQTAAKGGEAPTAESATATATADGAPPKTVKTTLNRAVLFERLEKAPGDVAARRALTPLLIDDDRGRLALLLAKDKWERAGFFQYVRWMQTVKPALLAPPVMTALQNVARAHPKKPVREWAIRALTRAPGLEPTFFAEMSGKGSVEALRAQIYAAEDGFKVLYATSGHQPGPARDAAYDILTALAKLKLELSDEQRVLLVMRVANELAKERQAKPWRFLRAIYQLMRTRPKLDPANEATLLSALRPYCLSAKGQKPWWDALLTVKRIGSPASEKIIADAIASVATAKGRRIMTDRLSIE